MADEGEGAVGDPRHYRSKSKLPNRIIAESVGGIIR
jgi:hypothetical protein